MGNIHVVGPSEALIVSGGCCTPTQKRTIIGGWGWAWWCVTNVQILSLKVLTLNPKCERVETCHGVPLTVTGVAQCKVMRDKEFLELAAEQFLGKSVSYVQKAILYTMEGHLRAILGTLTVEEVYRDRERFASQVRDVAAPDVGKMGIEILSFTIKDVYDEVEYLSSLGKTQTALVKRDAAIGVAEANRDAGIKEAVCDREAETVKYAMNTKIEDNRRAFKLEKQDYDKQVNAMKAQAELAYSLQAAIINQDITKEKTAIEVVECRKNIEIEEQEIKRRKKELTSTIKLPAEAEAFRVETVAQGVRTKAIESARAESQKIKLIGDAEAHAIETVGVAEASEMKMKAKAYNKYGEAAVMSIVMEALPKIAAEVAAPLSKTQDIVMLGADDRMTSEVAKLAGQLPPAVHALTGVDIKSILGKKMGAAAGSSSH